MSADLSFVPAARLLASTPAESTLPRLPTAWRAAVAFCPWCSGTGGVDAPGDDYEHRGCLYCEATGDLFGTLLRAAYKQGRDDALAKLGQVREVVALAIDHLEGAPVATNQLKKSLGLP